MKTFTALFLFSLLFALATSSLLKQARKQVPACVGACYDGYNVCASGINPDVNPGKIAQCKIQATACCQRSPCNRRC